jgi:ribose transport system ATP-binding protein
MITQMVGRNFEQLFPARTSTPDSAPMLTVQHLTEPGIVQDISLTLHKGEVLGLFGLMGSGRTELARMLFGLDSYHHGSVQVEGRAVTKPSPRRSIRSKVAFVTENRRDEGLLMNINIADNIALASLPSFVRTPVQVVDQRTLLESARHVGGVLQLKSGDINTQPAKSLSGGNQQKVVIAKWLLSEPSVFIMDEPTRGVDVGAKFEIYTIIDQLAATGQGVLFISSELEELTAMCDRILVMSRGELVGEFARAQFSEEAILRAAFREGAAAS